MTDSKNASGVTVLLVNTHTEAVSIRSAPTEILMMLCGGRESHDHISLVEDVAESKGTDSM